MATTGSGRSGWDKADILMKGLLPIAVAAVGYWGTAYLAQQQRVQATAQFNEQRAQAAEQFQQQHAQATAQFYTELLTKREDADSKLRQEVFKYIIDKFLGPAQNDPEARVLGLEMLAFNFHDSIALGPLFKSTYTTTRRLRPERPDLLKRLETVGREITDRQIASLAEPEQRWGAAVNSFKELRKPGVGSIPIMDRTLPADDTTKTPELYMRLEALAADPGTKTVQVRLEVSSLESAAGIVDATFWVSYFDFPMLDNTRFPNRQRLAVVLREFGADSAELAVVLFPETRASLKEKPYFDDLIQDMLHRTQSQYVPTVGGSQ